MEALKEAVRAEVAIQTQSAIASLSKVVNDVKVTIGKQGAYHELQKEMSAEILANVRETNGRVKSLELWKSYIVGGLTVISIMVVPILIYIIKQEL